LILEPGRRPIRRYSEEGGEYADESFDAYIQDYANPEKTSGVEYSHQTSEDSSVGGYAESESSSSGGKASGIAGRVKQKVQQGAERMRERARDQGRDLRERAGEVGHKVQKRIERGYQAAQGRLSAGYDRTRARLRETAGVHPLCTGAAFLGFGLLAGFLLPRTRREDEWFGDTSDSVKRRVKESGQDLIERSKHVAEAAAQTAKSEAERQGLTPGKLKESAQEIGRKAQEAARHAAEEEGVLPESMKAGGEKPESSEAQKAAGSSGTGAVATHFSETGKQARKTGP
jgi:hypothetical protein